MRVSIKIIRMTGFEVTFPYFSPIMLHIAGVRLLDTRESLFEQRMIAEMLYYYVCLYKKGVEVNDLRTTHQTHGG